jgi:transposase-like protein
VAIAVDGKGYREILGICEGAKEDKAGWSGFLKHLKECGLTGVRLIISDACLGLAESAAEYFADALWQRCVVHRIDELQADLDVWLAEYNEARPHQGRWCYGKTPMQTFIDTLPVAKEKLMQAV